MELNIDLSADLLKKLKAHCDSQYGVSNEAALSRVMEEALAMRLYWLELTRGDAQAVEEPVGHWDSEGGSDDVAADVSRWLFKEE
jgi:hypothetical protein